MLKRLIESHKEDQSYQHSVISLTDMGAVGKQLQAIGVDIKTLQMRSALDVARVLWQLVRMIRETRPCIVQTWMYHADLLGGLAARIAGIRHIIWGIRATDISVGNSPVTKIIRRVCAGLSYWLPDTIVCVAYASQKAHIALGYDSSRIVVIQNGFNLDDMLVTIDKSQQLKQECGFKDQEIVIGSLGRFNADKDHLSFIRAAGVLARRHKNLRFLMVGRGLDSTNIELMRWIFETGFAERFVLLGERTDVPVCLSVMGIFCLHSRTEGFPNVLGEAMAMALPCVATDVGDAALLIADTGGRVVPKQDSFALEAGLDELLMLTTQQRISLGKKAKQRIRDEFSMMLTRKRFEALYDKVLNREIG